MTITAYLIGDAELRARMDRMYPNAQKGLLDAVTRLAVQLQRHVMQDKLTGQVLQVRTGTLRRSINQRVTQQADSTTGQVGTNVVYARIHEYGGTVVRHSKKGPGRAVYPERSFLRTAMHDMEARIKAELEKAVRKAVNQ